MGENQQMDQAFLPSDTYPKRVSWKQRVARSSLRSKALLLSSVAFALAICALAIVGIVSLASPSSSNTSESEPVAVERYTGDILSPLTPMVLIPAVDTNGDVEDEPAEAQACACPRVIHQAHEEVIPHHRGSVCVGGCAGAPFVAHAYGELVRTLTIHTGGGAPNDAFTAIQVELTNGVTHVLGTNLGGRGVGRVSFTFQPGEFIVGSLLVGDNASRRDRDRRVGFLRFTTSTGRTFTAGRNQGNAAFFPVNGRFLSGVFGRHAANIDSLSFIFVRPVRSTRLINIEYPTLSFLTTSMSPNRLARTTLVNNAPNDMTQTIAYTRTVGTSNCWNSTHSRHFSHTITVRASILGIVTFTTESRWQVSHEQSQSECTNDTRSESTTTVITVPANHRCEVDITQMVNTINRLPFTADLELTFNDGTTHALRTSGMYSTVAVAQETLSRVCTPL